MGAILKKEVKGYFLCPTGYIILSIFYAFAGYLFFSNIIATGISDISYIFNLIVAPLIIVVPMLTMGAFSEEYKLNTDRLLFSSPVSIFSIVFGKFLSAFVMYLITISISFVYVFIVSLFAPISVNLLVGCVFATLLIGCALISMGIFISTLTRNQVVSAFSSFGLFMLFIVIDSFSSYIPFKSVKSFLNGLAIMPRFCNLVGGILNIPDILYFISLTAVFMFLISATLLKRRWS